MVKEEIDCLDLDEIADSGQCFRWIKLDEGKYRIPAFDRCLVAAQSGRSFEFFCSEEEYASIWRAYFDLDADYERVISKIDENDKFLRAAAEHGRGIRILRQDVWEAVISFIISQNSNIARIKKSIEALCRRYGRNAVKADGEDVCMIPRFEDIIRNGGRESLSRLGLGYRDEYIWEICSFYGRNPDFMDELRRLDYDGAMSRLMRFKGIGKKVANCICLFGLHHLNACPVDVWMKKIICEDYDGAMPAWTSDRNAGVYQQYAFFYKRSENARGA